MKVTLYTRQGCSLCDKTLPTLNAAQGRYGFVLEKADVDLDAELVAKYGDLVPVVAVNGKVRFWGCVNGVLLERLLRAEAEKAGL